MSATPTRRWEIDSLRGLAAVLMVVSNFLFDLGFFVGMARFQSGFVDWFARFVAGFFICLAGVSLTLRRARPGFAAAGLVAVLRRGGLLFALGLVVTAATRLAAGEQMVLFGVLHLIGLGIILAYPLLGRPRLCLVLGIVVLVAAPVVRRIEMHSLWLLWLGLQPQDYASVDYAPLFPWFGPMLLGIFLGHTLYPGGAPRWPLADCSRLSALRPLIWCGRHSLLIYFIHQPLLLAGLALGRRWW